MTQASSAAHRFARATALATFVLILAGASVTSTDSGLAVPDWPLSYGQWMPPMQGGVFFEHGHRMIASLVGLMCWILAALAWREGGAVRRLSLLAAGLVVVQGVLGGLTVLYGLAKPVSVVHACLAQALFSLLVYLAVSTGPARQAPADDSAGAGSMLVLACAAGGAVYLQLILGAAYRHGLAGILAHLLGAVAATGLVLAAAYRALTRFSGGSGLRGPASGLAALILFQLFLGLFAFLSRSPVAATLHVGTGALILALCVTLAARSGQLAARRLPAKAGGPALASWN